MHVRALAATPQLELITLHSTLGALALWLGVLIREWPQLTAYGVFCGEPQTLFGHCPLCFPAAALTVVAMAGMATLARRGARRA
jgi:hypothetical protein